MIAVGRITSVYGIKGWVKVYAYTDPKENIFAYQPWQLVSESGERLDIEVKNWKLHGKGLIAEIDGYRDRNQAMQLAGMEIEVADDVIPPAPEGEVYWRDLIGLSVVTQDGKRLGVVKSLFETGANDVAVIKGDEASIDRKQRLIPWVPERYIVDIDLDAKQLTVDWQPEWDEA